MITALLAEFGPWIVGILAVLGAAFGYKKSVESSAKAKGEAEAAKIIAKDREAIAASEVKRSHDAAKQNTKATENAIDAQHDVSKLDAGNAADELRDKWTRD